MSVTVLATLKLKPGLADTVLGGLKEMLPDTRAFAGCEDVLVCQDAHATRIWCLFLDRLPDVAGHIVRGSSLLRVQSDPGRLNTDSAGRPGASD